MAEKKVIQAMCFIINHLKYMSLEKDLNIGWRMFPSGGEGGSLGENMPEFNRVLYTGPQMMRSPGSALTNIGVF